MGQLDENIRKYRKKANLTQEELASLINKKKNSLSDWESGLHRPNADIIELLCRALSISPSDLFGWEDNKNNQRMNELNQRIIELDKTLQKIMILCDGEENYNEAILNLCKRVLNKK
jgi:transcriptional regulator with XRE-family HTH domain